MKTINEKKRDEARPEKRAWEEDSDYPFRTEPQNPQAEICDCGAVLQHSGGCAYCPVCGESSCG